MPTNAAITLRFDRFLDPTTANRQALRVYSGDPASSGSIPLQVVYDPIERVVQYQMPAGYSFEPNALYRLELLVPTGDDDGGLRAFDGAALAEGALPLSISFFTGVGPVERPRVPAPTCEEVVEQVLTAPPGDCASANSHTGSSAEAPHGLLLDSRAAFRATAIERVARQTELGDRSGGVPLERPARFGVRMPLVWPGSPGNSYLLYKLLRSPSAYEPCSVDAAEDPRFSALCREPVAPCESAYPELPLPPGDCLAPTDDELVRLREWFVRGEPMPLARPTPRYVGLQQLRAVSRFIAAGADCSN